MKKLLALIALISLFAMESEARHRRYKRSCAADNCNTCEEQVCNDCPSCDRAPECETTELPESIVCADKPACRKTFCVQPRKVCETQRVTTCKWICPKDCAIYGDEGSAKHATDSYMNGDGSY